MQDRPFRVLVFTKTAGFRHDSIPEGIAAVKTLAARVGFQVEATEDAAAFSPLNLQAFAVAMFLNTSGDVLEDDQQAALEVFVRSGGGFVGVHAAADTEHEWEWYGNLLGARFAGHPPIQRATIRVVDRGHPSTRCLPPEWCRTDEWYNYDTHPRDRIGSAVRILANLDEASYSGGSMGSEHPIAWCHEFQGGRVWYTGLGHTTESYSEPEFLEHLLGGILWSARRD